MGAHRLEFPTVAEIATEYQTERQADPHLQRQLGRRSIDQLTLAQPSESHPYIDIERGMKQAIVGQEQAIEAILGALNRESLRNPKRPIANLLFLGPTGVGKSETAKELADLLHEEGDGFVKIDCSSFSDKHMLPALTGAGPMYVGREQLPQLNRSIIEKEKSVVLFDEIEKGCPELFDLLLQIMDDGELLQTNTGEVISFRNSIVVLTSNLGSAEMMSLLNPKQVGFQSANSSKAVNKQQINAAVNNALKRHFRPEFVNRIDQRVVFDPLTDDQLGQVLDRYVDSANQRYKDDAGIALTITPEVRERLVANNPDRHQFGARPILRDYDWMVESSLAKHINTGVIPQGSNVYAVLGEQPTGYDSDSPLGINFYFESNPLLVPKPKTKEIVYVASEAGVQEEQQVA